MTNRLMSRNTLFYGDNPPISRENILSESVMIYLDPPFNSNGRTASC